MATKEDYLRKQEVLKLWGQIVDLFLSVHGGTLNNGSTNSPLTIKAGGTTTLHKNYSVITYLDNNSTTKGGQMGFYQDTPELRTWNGSSYSSWYTIYHTGNCNKSDVSWTCNNLTAYGDGSFNGGLAAKGIADLTNNISTCAYNLHSSPSIGISSNVKGISYKHTLDPSASGMFPNNNWASAILTIRRHSDNGYTSQLGFSNTEMYFRASLSGSWYTIYHSGNNGSASDRRLKSNIKPLTLKSAKDIVMGANPVTFKWNKKAEELRSDLKGEDLGLIAQDVKDLVPSAIGTIFDEYEKLDYTKFIAPLIKVVQEQQREIDELKKQLNNK